jgi:hypothetical protein
MFIIYAENGELFSWMIMLLLARHLPLDGAFGKLTHDFEDLSL